ncbi:hypothetical protein CVT26_002808 [Gymnopilus dilepis]|uniref:Uncharacterized protein n=1 Tax=Gymnopilus dilepis TaxID=231916 RepID=A0A409Y390_9AGAR|nr:hypothetical protein CVT26_002808 [Gymnopilus dilepis]
MPPTSRKRFASSAKAGGPRWNSSAQQHLNVISPYPLSEQRVTGVTARQRIRLEHAKHVIQEDKKSGKPRTFYYPNEKVYVGLKPGEAPPPRQTEYIATPPLSPQPQPKPLAPEKTMSVIESEMPSAHKIEQALEDLKKKDARPSSSIPQPMGSVVETGDLPDYEDEEVSAPNTAESDAKATAPVPVAPSSMSCSESPDFSSNGRSGVAEPSIGAQHCDNDSVTRDEDQEMATGSFDSTKVSRGPYQTRFWIYELLVFPQLVQDQEPGASGQQAKAQVDAFLASLEADIQAATQTPSSIPQPAPLPRVEVPLPQPSPLPEPAPAPPPPPAPDAPPKISAFPAFNPSPIPPQSAFAPKAAPAVLSFPSSNPFLIPPQSAPAPRADPAMPSPSAFNPSPDPPPVFASAQTPQASAPMPQSQPPLFAFAAMPPPPQPPIPVVEQPRETPYDIWARLAADVRARVHTQAQPGATNATTPALASMHQPQPQANTPQTFSLPHMAFAAEPVRTQQSQRPSTVWSDDAESDRIFRSAVERYMEGQRRMWGREVLSRFGWHGRPIRPLPARVAPASSIVWGSEEDLIIRLAWERELEQGPMQTRVKKRQREEDSGYESTSKPTSSSKARSTFRMPTSDDDSDSEAEEKPRPPKRVRFRNTLESVRLIPPRPGAGSTKRRVPKTSSRSSDTARRRRHEEKQKQKLQRQQQQEAMKAAPMETEIETGVQPQPPVPVYGVSRIRVLVSTAVGDFFTAKLQGLLG